MPLATRPKPPAVPVAIPAKGDYLQGSFVRTPRIDGSVASRNPGDLDHLVGTFSYAAANVDEAAHWAQRALPAWRELLLEERVEQLAAVADQLHQVTDQLAAVVTCEVGKPRWEARMEVLATVRQCDILLQDGPPLLESQDIEAIRGTSRRWPLGVVAAIGPSPVPVFVPMGYILSALLSGNTVVFNPSSRTPATGQLIAEVMDRSGLPRGVFNMVQGPGDPVGWHLATHPEVDALVYAGHNRAARAIVRGNEKLVRKRIITQTGGKGTAVVLADTDLDRAVYEVVTGAFLTGGQRFNSTARVVVEDAVYDGFRERALALTASLKVGYGFDPDVFMGPVLSAGFRSEVLARVEEMEVAGTDVPLRGRVHDAGRAGHYLTPTILEHGERAHNGGGPEEVPGPVLALERSADREATWVAADRATYGLCAAVFTGSEDAFEEAHRRLHVGSLNWNRATVAASGRLPIASWGRAGKGSEGNAYLVRALTHPTSVLGDPGPFDPTRLMPGVAW
jgi:succinylglutamic semialdehyde dehydrogenase